MGKYDDIINLPHHVSPNRIPMSMEQRAAQFAPFAALSGHGEAIREVARVTDSRLDLAEHEIEHISALLYEAIEDKKQIKIDYFVPDMHKAGGQYASVTGIIREHCEIENTILLDCGIKINLFDILNVSCDI